MTPISIQIRGLTMAALHAMLVAVTVACLGTIAMAQGHDRHNHGPSDPLKDIPLPALLEPGELPEITLGKADAVITIVEYASMTCAHCGRVHREVIPLIKAKYIDTGIARLIVREFPVEKVAMAVSMLARCAGPDNTYAVISAMFEHQQRWLKSGDIRADLLAILSPFGMTEETFKSCLENKPLFHRIKAVRQRGTETFGVNQTPTFFINGKPLVGPRSIEAFDEIIAPLLKR